MTLRWWYLSRGVPWPAVLIPCGGAALLVATLARWPSLALVLLPAVLACCAAAAAFVFDEQALSVVAVTPRGSAWRRTARLAVALVPLGVWGVVVLARPGDLPLERAGWWLIGGAGVVLAVGLAALASRREVPAPGATLAGAAALVAIAPVVVSGFLGWSSVYPFGDFAGGVWVFWLVLAGVGVSALGAGVRR